MWNEGINGDLSGNRLLPTNLNVVLGSNELIGSTGNTGTTDRDYFHISLTGGQKLTKIILRNYVSADDIAFIAVQAGTIITEDPTSANVGNLLGWTFFGTPQIGLDLLAPMGTGSGAIGFTPPLTGSDYTFWIQQTGDPTDYVMDFQVVPEPSSLAALAGLALLLKKKRKRVT
jgi:hypothetical protein